MHKKLTISIGQHSIAGRKAVNQDFHGIYTPVEPQLSTKGIIIALADGISSSDVSHIASQTAIKSFIQDYYCTSDAWSVKTSAQRVLKATNSWLYAQSQCSPLRFNKDKGYICTFSAIVLKSNSAHLFHSGDSRIYRLVDDTLEQLTIDHRRRVSEQVSYLTRGLGIHDQLEVDYRSLQLAVGDVFVLATDGVYEFLSEKSVADAIANDAEDLDSVARDLVDQAYERGSDDNLTLQIIRIEDLPERNLDEVTQKINLLPAPPKLSAKKDFDGYRVLREIHISSRSHVFLAQDKDSGDRVVIKTPSTEMRNNSAFLENILMEEWVAKRINNTHVLKAIDSPRKRNYLYTVTEYVEGKTLTQWMADNPGPTIDDARSIIEQVAKGLQAFHRQEMVHQDLRPENIMIDTEGTVKIIDFGSTKINGISEIVKRNEGIVGTAQYTAPEYYLGQLGTSHSDLFSLGVIAYQLLSGKLPYGAEIAKTDNLRAQQRLKYRPLMNNKNNIPGWIDFAIKKAVEIKPIKRYNEVSEFVYDLKHPNPEFLRQERPPLIERDPVFFWKIVCVILLCLLTYQSIH